jgi:probable HAF family extracellular repeat protein
VKRSIRGILLVLTFVAVGIAAAPLLTFTFSDVHSTKTATETDSYAVNNNGVIAGDYIDSAGIQHGMILAGTKVTTVNNSSCLTAGGAVGAIAFYGINKTNAAAGWCANVKTGADEGFVYASGKFTAIIYPKATGTQANGINDKGDVVGLYLDSSGNSHGFLYTHATKKYAAINVKGAAETVAYGINNLGDIALYTGTSASGGVVSCPCTAYVRKGTILKKLTVPKAGTTGAVSHAINNKGDIDGTYYDSSGNRHGWLLHAGKYYDVDDPKGPNGTRDDGINDSLEMVGRYTPTGGSNSLGFKVTTK